MAKVNGIKLTGVPPELIDRLRQLGDSDILWAWNILRDGEPAVLATTGMGLRVVTLGGEQRLNWADLGETERLDRDLLEIRTRAGVGLRLQFRSREESTQFAGVVEDLELADESIDESMDESIDESPEMSTRELGQTLLRMEAHLARIVELLEAGQRRL